MTINLLLHPAATPTPANEPVVAAAPASRAEHERAKFLDIRAFETAERLAEGARQSAVEQAAAELRAAGNGKTGDDYDKHNFAVYAAEQEYLRSVISAAEKHGVLAHGWKQALATLPPVVPSAVRAAGKAAW